MDTISTAADDGNPIAEKCCVGQPPLSNLESYLGSVNALPKWSRWKRGYFVHNGQKIKITRPVYATEIVWGPHYLA